MASTPTASRQIDFANTKRVVNPADRNGIDTTLYNSIAVTELTPSTLLMFLSLLMTATQEQFTSVTWSHVFGMVWWQNTIRRLNKRPKWCIQLPLIESLDTDRVAIQFCKLCETRGPLDKSDFASGMEIIATLARRDNGPGYDAFKPTPLPINDAWKAINRPELLEKVNHLMTILVPEWIPIATTAELFVIWWGRRIPRVDENPSIVTLMQTDSEREGFTWTVDNHATAMEILTRLGYVVHTLPNSDDESGGDV